MAMSVTYTNFGGHVVYENRSGTERNYERDPLGYTTALMDMSGNGKPIHGPTGLMERCRITQDRPRLHSLSWGRLDIFLILLTNYMFARVT